MEVKKLTNQFSAHLRYFCNPFSTFVPYILHLARCERVVEYRREIASPRAPRMTDAEEQGERREPKLTKPAAIVRSRCLSTEKAGSYPLSFSYPAWSCELYVISEAWRNDGERGDSELTQEKRRRAESRTKILVEPEIRKSSMRRLSRPLT
jgi:hypothetical protein